MGLRQKQCDACNRECAEEFHRGRVLSVGKTTKHNMYVKVFRSFSEIFVSDGERGEFWPEQKGTPSELLSVKEAAL